MQMRHEFTIWMENVRSGLRMTDKALLEIFGDMANVLPPKAFSGSSIKSSVAALEAFATDRLAVK